MVYLVPCRPVGTVPTAFAFSISRKYRCAGKTGKVHRNKDPDLVGVVSLARPNKLVFC